MKVFVPFEKVAALTPPEEWTWLYVCPKYMNGIGVPLELFREHLPNEPLEPDLKNEGWMIWVDETPIERMMREITQTGKTTLTIGEITTTIDYT